jgi:hypothetical protein
MSERGGLSVARIVLRPTRLAGPVAFERKPFALPHGGVVTESIRTHARINTTSVVVRHGALDC